MKRSDNEVEPGARTRATNYMYIEKSLIDDARKRINGQSAGRVAYVDGLIEEWIVACKLSRGPDPNRSAHWQRRAKELRDMLEAIAGTKFAESIG